MSPETSGLRRLPPTSKCIFIAILLLLELNPTEALSLSMKCAECLESGLCSESSFVAGGRVVSISWQESVGPYKTTIHFGGTGAMLSNWSGSFARLLNLHS